MSAIQPFDRNLPADLPAEVTRMGYRLLRAADRLGLCRTTAAGETFGLCFERVHLVGDVLALYVVDCERLPRPKADFCAPKVLDHFASVIKRPVKADPENGLTYFVMLRDGVQGPVSPALPTQAELDLDVLSAGRLAVPVGVGPDGLVARSLPGIGHALIVGASGTGKSCFVHAALAALMARNDPAQVQLGLVDLKRSEFVFWSDAPHLYAPIAVTPAQAGDLLADLVCEIDRRGDLLAQARTRDLAGYNARADKPLPYILLVIDEALDLLADAGREGKGLISNLRSLAVRGRSAGVLVWMATQHAAAIAGMPRPAVVNMQSRFVFRVVDRAAAEAAGCPGAHDLPRTCPGRLLARLDGEPVALQGHFIPEDELLAIAAGLAARPVEPAASLTPGETALVRYAITQLDGAFPIGRLEAQFRADGWDSHKLRYLAARWEHAGWLTPPLSKREARRVTQQLAALLDCAESA